MFSARFGLLRFIFRIYGIHPLSDVKWIENVSIFFCIFHLIFNIGGLTVPFFCRAKLSEGYSNEFFIDVGIGLFISKSKQY